MQWGLVEPLGIFFSSLGSCSISFAKCCQLFIMSSVANYLSCQVLPTIYHVKCCQVFVMSSVANYLSCQVLPSIYHVKWFVISCRICRSYIMPRWQHVRSKERHDGNMSEAKNAMMATCPKQRTPWWQHVRSKERHDGNMSKQRTPR